MTYRDQLHPWCITRPLPNLQRIIVARFRRRNDAEAHLQVIRRLVPDVTYTIVFDVPPEHSNGNAIGESLQSHLHESSVTLPMI